ncbi:MAG: CinA family protein [Chloroflexota bacterium]
MSPPSEAELARLGAQLGDALRARHWRVATAESSTGGLIGHVITMTPGASDYYAGGAISYSNLAKELALGVPRELIEAHGAVSEEVAASMAVGAAQRFDTDVGISVTGIAGPEGGSDRKPVGTHYLGVVRRGHPARVEHHVFVHDRDGNRAAAAMASLELALDEVSVAG